MIYGTSYFPSIQNAIRYYRPYGYSNVREAVLDKIRDGEIHIGKPPLKEGEKAILIDSGLRYAVLENVTAAMNIGKPL